MAINKESSIENYFLNESNYVSAGDGEVYIGDILLDECYDIQYAYREMKEPVYGYRSKYYSSVIPGTVIISGQFTINYIHDAYLFTLLEAQQHDSSQELVEEGRKLVTGQLHEDNIEKKNLLQRYNYIRRIIDEKDLNDAILDSQMKVYQARISDLDNKKVRTNEHADARLNNIDKQKDTLISSWWSNQEGKEDRIDEAEHALEKYNFAMNEYYKNKENISADIPSMSFTYSDEISLLANPILEELMQLLYKYMGSGVNMSETDSFRKNNLVRQLYDLNESYQKAISKFVEPGWFNTDARDFARFEAARDTALASREETLNQLQIERNRAKDQLDKLSGKKSELTELKEEMNRILAVLREPAMSHYITDQGGNFKKLDAGTYLSSIARSGQEIKAYRPEDIQQEIRLKFRYQGMVHKVLDGVKLIGHSHLLGVGGQPVQETYMFLARKIDNE